MKKMKLVFGLLILAIMVLGCSTSRSTTAGTERETKMLIVFFSHTGNAKFVAEHIQTLTGADVFELVPTDPYHEDFAVTSERVRQEQETGVFPSLVGEIENFADYDVIFLGSPVWFDSLSSPVRSFLNSYDLSGKTIVPFITFGRGSATNTIAELRRLVPGATILEEFGVSRDDVNESQPNITQWLNQIGMYGQ